MLKNIAKFPFTSGVGNNFVRAMRGSAYKTLAASQPSEFVTHVELNRPDKFNAFNHQKWLYQATFDDLSESPDCRAIVLKGSGKHFTAGQEGPDQIREINRLNLQGEDFIAACMTQATKRDKPVFAKL